MDLIVIVENTYTDDDTHLFLYSKYFSGTIPIDKMMCDLFKAFYSGSYISSLLKKHNFYAGRPMSNSILCFFLDLCQGGRRVKTISYLFLSI